MSIVKLVEYGNINYKVRGRPERLPAAPARPKLDLDVAAHARVMMHPRHYADAAHLFMIYYGILSREAHQLDMVFSRRAKR